MSDMEQSKACNKCGQIKNRSDFYNRNKTTNAVMAVCKICKNAADTAYQKAKAKAKVNTRSNIVCLFCHIAFQPTRDWQKCCSKVCGYSYQNKLKTKVTLNYKFCGRCGKSLLHKRITAIYCSKTCSSMDNNFKYRGTEANRVETARRKAIMERDNYQCYLCLAILTPDKIEIDHLIPRSRFGTSAAENLAVSCRKCNRSRGNRIGIEQLIRLHELRPANDC